MLKESNMLLWRKNIQEYIHKKREDSYIKHSLQCEITREEKLSKKKGRAVREGKGHITYFYREEGFANREGWTESMKGYDGISHSPTPLSIWALSFVKVCVKSQVKKNIRRLYLTQTQYMLWRVLKN